MARATIVATLVCLTVGVAGEARAQLLEELLNPSTTVPPPGTPEAPPTTWALLPLAPPAEEKPPAPAPGGEPAPAPAPAAPAPAAAAGGPSPFGDGDGEGVAPPDSAGPFPNELAAMMRSVRRSGPRNSRALVDSLKALTDLGMPADEAVRVGLGSFPVGGYATYSHDWWFPRFGPGWRLHQGTDIFATRGTPVRSPALGTVRLTNGGLGGRSTYVVQDDGTYFYLAHLDSWPAGLRDGQVVNVGDVVGYVGTTGNAQGTSPHVHFEVHPAVKVVQVGRGKKATTKVVHAPVPPGTILPAADPKALLDSYLQAAGDSLPGVVAAFQASAPPPVPVASAGAVDPALIGPSLRLASRRGLLLSGAQPALSVPLVGFAFLLVVMLGCLTPVLGTSAKVRSVALAGGGEIPFADLGGTVPALSGHDAAERTGRRRRRRRSEPSPGSPVVTMAMAPASVAPSPAGGGAGAGPPDADGGTRGRGRLRRRAKGPS
ncbi:MAG TPA: M23 family metallopeptidase [Acidimicrobiales bacterium]|nr:M23 family metallopeptidase [Acidimicrobiales bacterium]